ncbi:MAG: hypothetical protein IJZ23_03985 [Roseburia sp.]|nr:hypothetical protein [Roseburia sp.]
MQNIKSSCKERFAPVVEALRKLAEDETKSIIVVALDGKCASGKSTLGFYLQEMFDANLFHADDFFLQTHQRTEERLAEVGGNVDYERLKAEVIEPMLAGASVHYRRFDCKSMTIAEGTLIPAKRINIIEGSYCMNPYFGDIYDLKVFTEIGEAEQIENIRNRNGEEKLKVFKERWIPKEEAYFEKFRIKEQSDIVVEWRKTNDLYSDI